MSFLFHNFQQSDISVDQKTTTGGRTALHLAASQGGEGVVRALLTAGADARYRLGQGGEGVVRALLTAGADARYVGQGTVGYCGQLIH